MWTNSKGFGILPDMAANTTPTPEAVEFGQHLMALYEKAGGPSFGMMSRTIAKGSGIEIVDQTLSNWHKGRIDPRKVGWEKLRAVVRFYGCTPVDLGPVAAAELARLDDLMASDQQFAWSRCTVLVAA